MSLQPKAKRVNKADKPKAKRVKSTSSSKAKKEAAQKVVSSRFHIVQKRNYILHAQALSDVKATSIAGKELASMGESEQDKVAANLTTNLQKKVNKVSDFIRFRK